MRNAPLAVGIRVFRALPPGVRRRVVRTLAPTYTVGAICAIDSGADEVLLVRQSYRRRWGIPGGLVQRGEPIHDAARREVLEEVGLVIDLWGEANVVIDSAAHRVDVVFAAGLGPDQTVDLARPCSPEIAEVRWFHRHELPELQPETIDALLTLERAGKAPGFAGVDLPRKAPGEAHR